jgi:hypothetical protein
MNNTATIIKTKKTPRDPFAVGVRITKAALNRVQRALDHHPAYAQFHQASMEMFLVRRDYGLAHEGSEQYLRSIDRLLLFLFF